MRGSSIAEPFLTRYLVQALWYFRTLNELAIASLKLMVVAFEIDPI